MSMGDKLAKLAVYIGAASLMIVLNASIIKEIFGGLGMMLSAIKSAASAIPNAINGASRLKDSVNNLRGNPGASGASGKGTAGASGKGVDGLAGAGGKAGGAAAAAISGAAATAGKLASTAASTVAKSAQIAGSGAGAVASGISRGKGLAVPASAPSMGKNGIGGSPSFVNTKGLKSPYKFSGDTKRAGNKLNGAMEKNPALKSLNPEKMLSQSGNKTKSEINRLAESASKEAYNDSIARGQSEEKAQLRSRDVSDGIKKHGNEIASAYRKELGPNSDERAMMSKYNQLNDIKPEAVGKLDAGERSAYAENMARQIQSQTSDSVYKDEENRLKQHYKDADHGRLSTSNRNAAEQEARRIADAAGMNAYKEALPVANSLTEKGYARFGASQAFSQNEQLMAQRQQDYAEARNAFANSQKEYERLTTVQPGKFRGGDSFNIQTHRKEGSGESALPSQSDWNSFVRKNVDRFGQLTDKEADIIAGRAKFNFESSVSMFRKETGGRSFLENVPGKDDSQKLGNLMTGFATMESLAVVPEMRAQSVMMNVSPDYKDGAGFTLGYDPGKGSSSSVFDIGVAIHNESVARPNATVKQISDSVAARRISNQLNSKFPFT